VNALKIHREERQAAVLVPLQAHLTDRIAKIRDGALVAAFELAGTAFEAKTPEQRDLYKEQLNVALRNSATARLGLWSILTRRRVHPDLARTYPNAFAQRVGDAYARLQEARTIYQNRLWLVLVYRVTALRTQVALSKQTDQRLVRDLLIAGIDELEDIAAKLGSALTDYGPRRLGVYTHSGNRFSEIGELYSLLLNHAPERVPVGPFDLGQAIGCNRLLFGREVFEVRRPGDSRFGAALAIKEYLPQTYPEMFTGLMEEPYELNWVQSFAFLDKDKAKDLFATQRRRLVSAGDAAVSQVAALEEAMDQLISNRFVVGDHNAALIVYGEDLDALARNVAFGHATLADPGNVVVREDMALEGQVYAVLPGNAKYRPRKAPITSLNFAAMSPFYAFPAGTPDGHHWGEAVTLFRSTVDTPLWFSPHVGDLGHTSVIGMSGAGKTALLAFLLAQLQRFPARHVILDKDQGLKLAVLALGGRYHSLKTGVPTGFNPFALPYSPAHANYLHDLVRLLAGGSWDAKASREVEEGIKAVYSVGEENRRLASLVEFLDGTQVGGVAERLRAWTGEGRFAWAFDNRADSLQLGRLTAFDVTEFLDNPDLRTPITSYLLYRTEPLIDGTPFALWIDEFWKILDDAYFEGFVRDKLKTIRKKDGIVVTSTQSPADALDSKISAALLEQTPTKIFLPNEYADEGDYRDGFKLTPAEWALLRPLTKSSRKFLLKQAAGSALVDFDLSGRGGAGMDGEMAILSGTERSIRLADRIAEEHGGTLPADWISLLEQRRRTP
jgi:type IV secretion system protein VirB4